MSLGSTPPEPHFPLLEFIERFVKGGYAGFLPSGFPVHFLVIQRQDLAAGIHGSGDEIATRTLSAPAKSMHLGGKWDSPLFAAPLVKSGERSGEGLITLGRGPGNDILVSPPSVSRFHAYFVTDGSRKRMAIWDARSKNGTRVDGVPLVPGEGALLRSGGVLLFAQDVRVLFFSTDDFTCCDYSERFRGMPRRFSLL